VVREAMEAGAWGLSTGLDYPPGAYASTEELIALSKVSARLGGFYHTHTRASLRAKGLLAPWEEALQVGRGSGSPVHLTHYRQSAQGVGSHMDYLGLVENARAEGMDVTFELLHLPVLQHHGRHCSAALGQGRRAGGADGPAARQACSGEDQEGTGHRRQLGGLAKSVADQLQQTRKPEVRRAIRRRDREHDRQGAPRTLSSIYWRMKASG